MILSKHIVHLALISLILAFQSNFAQEDLSQKSKQLNQIRTEIQQLEKVLSAKSEEEKKSNSTLKNLSEQVLLLSKIIVSLNKDETKLNSEIENLEDQIEELETEIKQLRENYSNYIAWIYKYGKAAPLMYLFGSQSVSQALVRYKYLSAITESHQEAVNNIRSKIEIKQQITERLKEEINKKEKIVSAKLKEKSRLENKKSQREIILDKLKSDQLAIAKEIEEKRIAEVQIKKIIDRLNEEERKRKEMLRTERLKSNKLETKFTYDYDNYENFSVLKGKLSWPVSSGKVVRQFGENKNKRLNTITLNYGIDIGTKESSEIYSVAEGRVSAIDWIPGYGSIVIITHRGDFRTVYGHLEEISVAEGDIVKSGTVIGKVSKSLEGNILHFEIWEERNYENPEVWLVRK